MSSLRAEPLPRRSPPPSLYALPLSHAKISAFYLQLGQQLGAGLTLAQSLRAPSPAPRADTERLVRLIEAGEPVATVFAAAGPWLPSQDRPFLVAAADSGRLPLILHSLSTRHAELGTIQGRVLMACLYPVGVLHFGALVFAFFRLLDWEKGLQWSTPGFVFGVLLILLPFWGLAITLAVLVRRRNPAALTFLDLLPVIGRYRRHQALADFSFALGHLLEAGAPIAAAWSSAGHISGSRRIAAAAEAIRSRIMLREAPSAHLAAHRVFPGEFIAFYTTGETTGSLDKNLLHVAGLEQERASKQLTFAAIFYPGLLFFAVAALVLYIVISAYAGYVANLNRIIEGG